MRAESLQNAPAAIGETRHIGGVLPGGHDAGVVACSRDQDRDAPEEYVVRPGGGALEGGKDSLGQDAERVGGGGPRWSFRCVFGGIARCDHRRDCLVTGLASKLGTIVSKYIRSPAAEGTGERSARFLSEACSMSYKRCDR